MKISPENSNDPFGLAIQEFEKFADKRAIIHVWSHLNEKEHINVSYLFRSKSQMPGLEKKALNMALGKVLDVGAAAGCHTQALLSEGFEVHAIEISQGACEHLTQKFSIPVFNEDIFERKVSHKYQTILALMNGTGIAGTLDQLPLFLQTLARHLDTQGQILIESTDISYMFSDGDIPYPPPSQYYGEVRYRMTYKNQDSGYFDWLFVNFIELKKCCESIGLKCEKVFETPTYSYLARISN